MHRTVVVVPAPIAAVMVILFVVNGVFLSIVWGRVERQTIPQAAVYRAQPVSADVCPWPR